MGSPIELISPAGGLPQPRRRVAVARLQRDRLRDERANGKRSSSASPNARRAAIASNVPEPLTIGCASVEAAERRVSRAHGAGTCVERGRRRAPARRRRRARSRRRACGTTQPKQAPKPQAIPASSASCAGTSRAAHSARTASSIARRAAGVDVGARVGVELGGEQLGDEAVVAGRAVVGRHARSAQQRRALGVRGVAEAEQRPARRRRRRAARPGRIASGAMPTPPPHEERAAAVLGRGEADARAGPSTQSPSPGAQLAQPRRARADVLEHEVELAVAPARAGPRRRAAGTGRSSLPRPSARPRRACRTGRAAAPGPSRVRRREHDVGAELAALGDAQAPAPERRRRAGAPRRVPMRSRGASPRVRPPWSSCSDSTSGSPRRAAAIARAAASPPDSVVRHGMPRATAARRISQPSVRAPEPVGRVDDEVDVAALDPVDDVRRALADLVQRARPGCPCARSPRPCRAWRRSGSRGRGASAAIATAPGLVAVGDGDEDGAASRAARRRRPPAPWRTRSGSRARRPSPRRSSASPARAARRRPRSGRTAARPP